MVFQVGRSTVRLFSSSSAAASYRLFSVPLLQRVSAAYNSIAGAVGEAPSITHVAGHVRAFATRPASRPKAHTGRTTTTPRKAKAKATTEATAAKTNAGTAPKAKSSLRSKAKAKPKAKAKAKAKAKSKKVRKPSEKAIALAAARAVSAKKRDLKLLALKKPTELPATPFLVINQELSKDAHGLRVKEASAKFKALQPAELENYNHIANENKAANLEAYRKWVESYTPDQIRQANVARRQLKRQGVKSGVAPLKDDRQVKRSLPPYINFVQARYASGDMHGITAPDAARLIGTEWRALSEAEKENYYSAAAKDKARYADEVKRVYNREVAFSAPSTP